MAARNRSGPGRRRAAPPARRGASRVLAAAAVGGTLALSGVLATGDLRPGPRLAADSVVAAPTSAATETTSRATPGPTTKQEVDPSTAPPTSSAAPRRGDPDTPQAQAFLEALRAADVPTSRRGVIEVQVAEAVCSETEAGTSRSTMEQGIPGVLPTVTSAQAARLIDAALEHYC
jgi:hypothetical protein